jgi:HK97 gp10 family phage protein
MADGIEALRRKFQALPEAVKQAVRDRMEKLAGQWVAQMKFLVPVQTGALRDSINWTWGAAPGGSIAVGSIAAGEGLRITIYAGSAATVVRNSRGAEFQNARIQEFGTKARPAHPYFFPVIRANKRGAQASINAAARKAAKVLW